MSEPREAAKHEWGYKARHGALCDVTVNAGVHGCDCELSQPVLPSVEALTDAIESQDLYHGRYGTVPAGETTARAILSCLRNHHGYAEPSQPVLREALLRAATVMEANAELVGDISIYSELTVAAEEAREAAALAHPTSSPASPATGEGLRDLAASWRAAADRVMERALMGDPGMAMAIADAYRYCANALGTNREALARGPQPDRLDVERLARAIDAHYQSEATHPFHDCAEMIAAEYARLAATTPNTEEKS